MRESIEGVHLAVEAGPPVERQEPGEHGGQGDVKQPEPPRGVADPRGERARNPGPGISDSNELAATDPQPGQDGQGEHDDSHAAEPLGVLPLHEHASGTRLDIGQHARARGREAGHRLEEGIHGACELRLAGNRYGSAAEEAAESSQRQRDDEEALARRRRAPSPSVEPFERHSR